ncbi:MAG: DUF1579 domain-containing protein [Candidatus Aminicenantes bacterium]|nr:DUF1579 domain-containing protein [Candidatus Aminicenantes bacterium]
MKSRKLMVTLATSFILFSASYNWTQQSPDEKTMMENWMKYATPGKPHQFLAMQEGEWEVVVKMWMRPGASPNESKGMAHGKMILGGRYLQMQHHGMMMGMHFEGITIGAYDNHLMTFISIWIDNMGTGFFQSMGSLDNTGKILTEIGEMFDPMTGNNLKMRTVTTYSSNEKFIKVMYHTMPDGKEFKSMEMVYTRKR